MPHTLTGCPSTNRSPQRVQVRGVCGGAYDGPAGLDALPRLTMDKGLDTSERRRRADAIQRAVTTAQGSANGTPCESHRCDTSASMQTVSTPMRPRSSLPPRCHSVEEAHHSRHRVLAADVRGEPLRGLHVVGSRTIQSAALPGSPAHPHVRCGPQTPPDRASRAPPAVRHRAWRATLPCRQAGEALLRPQEGGRDV